MLRRLLCVSGPIFVKVALFCGDMQKSLDTAAEI